MTIAKVTYLILFIGSLSLAGSLKLPGFYNDTKELAFSPISEGNEAYIDVTVLLPTGQILNEGAPSAVNIYEQTDKSWEKIEEIPLKQLLFLGQEIRVSKNVKLKSQKGDIAIGVTVYHCTAEHTLCVIDSFQGKIERKPELDSKKVTVSIKGTPPQF